VAGAISSISAITTDFRRKGFKSDRLLDGGDLDGVDFAVSVGRFLGNFGLNQEAKSLTSKAQVAAGAVRSRAWYLAQSNRGEQLLEVGQVDEAAQIFQAVLKELGDQPTYRRSVTLARLGRCFGTGGRTGLAAQNFAEALCTCDRLEPSCQVKRLRGVILTEIADSLAAQGKLAEARKAYQDALAIKVELKDLRGQGVTLGQLGTLAMLEGNLVEAADSHRGALSIFRQLGEPVMESVAWHVLGEVFQKAGQWEEAERYYREAARIREEHGSISGQNGAAGTWNQLAIVSILAGKPDAAERWLRKATAVSRVSGNPRDSARQLNNLANILQNQFGRLAEARRLAEDALTIARTLDPGAAEIWNTYKILGDIAEKEAQAVADAGRKMELQVQARDYRRLAREALRNFPGTRHEIRKHAPLILATVTAVQDGKHRKDFDGALLNPENHGWTKLVPAIRRILVGERDADALCANLDLQDSMIIDTILQGLADPTTLADLLPSKPKKP
jgi:tetratricopeptide (TPR) repeat protein